MLRFASILCLLAEGSSLHLSRLRKPHLPSSLLNSDGRKKSLCGPLNSATAFSFQEDSSYINISPLPRYEAFAPSWDSIDFNEDDDFGTVDMSFLPDNLMVVPPMTDCFLRKLTAHYIQSDTNLIKTNIDILDALAIIEKEYKYATMPFAVGHINCEFGKGLDGGKEGALHIFSKILSFAALHSLPKDMTIMLFGPMDETVNLDSEIFHELKVLVNEFVDGSWSSVSFPLGLSIRLKRECIFSRRKKYLPFPRNSIFTRSTDSLNAFDAIQQAQMVKPPTKLVPKQDIFSVIDAIDREFREDSKLSKVDVIFKEMLTFFPSQDRFIRRLEHFTSQSASLIENFAPAWLISYCALTTLCSTIVTILGWRYISNNNSAFIAEEHYRILQYSFFSIKAFVSTIVGSPTTIMTKMILSFIMVHLGNIAIKFMKFNKS